MVAENLQNQPESTFLDYQDQEIENLDVIMEQLGKFELLEELNISNNQFQRLPEDMSILKNVANLNVQNIIFDDFEQSIKNMATMPVLRSLYINLLEEDQVDLIIRNLPDLEYLNGLPVDKESTNQSFRSQDAHQTDIQNAVRLEAMANGGTSQIKEEEESQYNDDTQQDILNNNSMANGLKHDTSLLSTQSAIRNANILAQHLDTEELEQMAMIFDNIKQMRTLHDDF